MVSTLYHFYTYLVRQGLVYLQNLPSAAVAHVLGPRPGERILDMCAAPGVCVRVCVWGGGGGWVGGWVGVGVGVWVCGCGWVGGWVGVGVWVCECGCVQPKTHASSSP